MAQNIQLFMAAPRAASVAEGGSKAPVTSAAQPARSNVRPRLELPSGDFLPGEIADSDEPGVLAWQCDAMTRPFVFPLAAVRYVYIPRPREVAGPEGDYSIELAGGDMLYGNVESLSDDELVVDSPQHGRLRIAREEIRLIERTDALGGVLFAGPEGVADWQQEGVEGAWRDDSGALAADKPGKLTLAGSKLPAKIAIEVELAWRGEANFSLAFAPSGNPAESLGSFAKSLLGMRQPGPKADVATPKYAFELAAWDHRLTLLSEGDTKADVASVLRTLGADERLELQIFVDPDAMTVTVYSLAGDELAKVALPADAVPRPDGLLSLANRLGDVRLERLVVRRWNGATPGMILRDQAFVQLAAGGAIAAKSVRIDEGAAEAVVVVSDPKPKAADAEEDDAEASGATVRERRIPLTDVSRIAFPPAKKPRRLAMRAAQHNGVRLSGELAKVEDGVLTIERPGVDGQLTIPLADLRSLASLRADWPDPAPAGVVGRLEVSGGLVHGALVGGDDLKLQDSDANGCLIWQPTGSTTASPLKPDAAGRIVYREPPRAENQQPNGGPNAPPQPAPRRQGLFGGVFQAFAGAAATRPTALAAGDQLLWLKAGDRIPCRIDSIDDRGVRFTTPLVESKFVPHSAIKAWDAVAGSRPRDLHGPPPGVNEYYMQPGRGVQPRIEDPRRYERLLTLPRMQRENPPTHLIESTHGDFLRGRLASMDDKELVIEVRLETKRIPRSSIARIVWFDDPHTKQEAKADESTQAHAKADTTKNDADEPGRKKVAEKPSEQLELQAVRSDGVRLTFSPQRFAGGAIEGASDLLGKCRVELAMIDELIIGGAIADAAAGLVYSEWRLRPAPDPWYVAEDAAAGAPSAAGLESAMVGEPAPDISLESSSGGKLDLKAERGRVLVLDFWASWCGPCKAAMPQLRDALAQFDGDQVEWIAVNLQEDAETASAALERIGVSPRVAYDIDGAAAERYQVTAIPQTVVVDPQGKIAAVFVGSSPNLAADLQAAVSKALDADRDGEKNASGE